MFTVILFFLFFFLGFIDFIVNPTLNILGDVLESILKSLDVVNKKSSNSRRIAEEGTPENNNNNNNSFMKRPWIDNLTVNRERWQKKHDDGKH